MPLGRVLFEPVRSAEPPTISGTAAVNASRAISEVLRVELMQRVAPLQSVLAIQQARADESELLQGQSLRVRQASRLAAPLQVQEPAPWVLLEQRPRALPVRLVLPLA